MLKADSSLVPPSATVTLRHLAQTARVLFTVPWLLCRPATHPCGTVTRVMSCSWSLVQKLKGILALIKCKVDNGDAYEELEIVS